MEYANGLELCDYLGSSLWLVSEDYKEYKEDGGTLSPLQWNHRLTELEKER